MPIHLQPGEELPDRRPVRGPDEDRALLAAGLWLGVRAATWITAPAAAALVLALKGLDRSLMAADKLLAAHGEHWSDVLMPSVLLALLGALTGAVLAWRVMSAASVGRTALWAIIGPATLAITACGSAAAAIIFGSDVPRMCWISLAVHGAASFGGVYLVIQWLD